MTPELLHLSDDGTIPNNPRLPVLRRGGAFPSGDPASAEALLARNGWEPAWRNGIYPYHHYHPDAHEALAIVAGRVRAQLGGEAGPVLELEAGDLVVLPAGTGHRNLGSTPDLLVVGAYPPGQSDPQEFRGRPGERDRALPQIAALAPPPTDPVTGGAYPPAR